MNKSRKKPVWLLFFLLACTVVSYVYVQQHTTRIPSSPRSHIEKTGASAVADYTATAQKLHVAVDQALAAAGLTGQSEGETLREVTFPVGESLLRWHERVVRVSVPARLTLEAVRQAVAPLLGPAGGEVLAAQPDNYHGLPALRLDIGFRDTLEGEPVVCITDKIFLTREKAVPPSPSPAGGRGRLALIIDDFGYSQEPIAAFAAIDRPLTFSVLPYRPYSNAAAARGLSSGHQVMLHLPMEPLAAAEQSESGTITVNMTDGEIQAATERAVQAIPGIVGVNNHQGSRATADRRVMQATLAVLKAHNLFFVDSRTNSQSVAYDAARQAGVKTAENDLFIDNSSDVREIKAKLRLAGQMARRYGQVVAIGHARLSTAQAVWEMIPELEASGVSLVFVSQLVH